MKNVKVGGGGRRNKMDDEKCPQCGAEIYLETVGVDGHEIMGYCENCHTFLKDKKGPIND